jgi:hypothetical protein
MKKLLILSTFVLIFASCTSTQRVSNNRCNCDNTNLNFWWGWGNPYLNNYWLWDWRWGVYNNFPRYYIPTPNPITPPPGRYERRRNLPTYPNRTVSPSQPYRREYNDNMYPNNPSRNRSVTPSYDNRRYSEPTYNTPSRNYQNQNMRQPTQVTPRTSTPSNNSTTPYRRGSGNYQ